MPAFAWAIWIAFLLFSPGDGLPRFPFLQNIPHFDKFVHLILFGVQTLLLIFGLGRQTTLRARPLLTALIAVMLSAIYGAASEMIQGAIPSGRSADPLDFLADLAGIIGCFFLSLLWNGTFRASVNKNKSRGDQEIS